MGSITFLPDGNVEVEVINVPENGQPIVTTINIARYYMQEDNRLHLVLTPVMVEFILSSFYMQLGGEPDFSLMVPGITVLCCSLVVGIPLSVNTIGDVTVLYLDTPELKTHLKRILVPFFSEEKTLQVLEKKIKEVDSLAGLFDIRPLISSTIKELDNATKMQIGINFLNK